MKKGVLVVISLVVISLFLLLVNSEYVFAGLCDSIPCSLLVPCIEEGYHCSDLWGVDIV